MTEQKQRRKPRKYTDEFKQQLVELYRSGKRRCDICREYDIATSLFDKWVKQASNSGSFHEKDNRTPEQEELIRLRKENQQLRMEALIIMKQQQKKMNQNSLQTFRKFLEKAGTIMVHERSRKNWLIAGNRYQDAGLDGL